LFENFHGATHTLEKAVNGSETKAGKSISMFNHNLFDFALASRVYDLEKLTAVVIQSRSNFGAIKNDTITTFTTSLNQPLVLASKIFGLLLR
jgi:hypothetical protein